MAEGFDTDDIAILESVEADLLPLVRKYGWDAVNEAMFHDSLWKLKREPREGLMVDG